MTWQTSLEPNTKEYTFSIVHGTFSKIDHKVSLIRYRKTRINPALHHKCVKGHINNNQNYIKHTNSWKLSTTLLNDNQIKENDNQIKEEIKKGIKIFL